MSFRITTHTATAGDKSGDVFTLTDDTGTVRAEVWPFTGFNCLRWQLRQADGSWGNVLYSAPEWETNPVPTRSGHPILFPFPGRLKGGTFDFGGKSYRLPLNDATGKHAIHGFTPRNPWRVLESSANDDCATILGEFQLSRDLPTAVGHWPADFQIRVTYRLDPHSLTVMTTLLNKGAGPLPFGLGFHAYFMIPGGHDPVDHLVLKANIAKLWEADEGIPTGQMVPLPVELDFRGARPIGSTSLDHVFACVDSSAPVVEGLAVLAELSAADRPGRLTVSASSAFRELVLFIPPHRQAVAIEPYTCAADAAHLQSRGVDSGWQTLEAGETWDSTVEYRWHPTSPSRSTP